jgi:MFS family permease
LPWLVFQTTHSAIDVGVLVFCRYAPFAAFGLSAGVLADRFDNRKLLIATQCSGGIIAVALGTLVTSSSHPPLWMLYLLATLGGATLTLDAPSRLALTYQLVGRNELPNAVALNASVFNAGRIVGPAVAGVVIGSLGIAACFWLNAATYVLMLGALLGMRVSELIELDIGDVSGRPTIREGVRFVMQTSHLKLLLCVIFVISFACMNFRVLLPLLAGRTLNGNAEIFGLIWAAFGMGAFAGALYAAGTMVSSWRSFIASAAGFSLSLIVLAPIHSTLGVCVLLFFVGFTFTVWTSAGQSILQIATPDWLRGRVLGIYVFVITAFMPLGGMFAAWLVEIGGTELAFGVGGACGAVVALTAALRVRTGATGLASRTATSAISAD